MLDLHFIADHIGSPPLRALTRRLLDEADPQFWVAPASSTGKYHPEYDCGVMGLVRHTGVVAVSAVDALRRYYGTGEVPRDMVDVVLCAGLLHDLCKNGYPEWGPYTRRDHPRIGSERVWAERPSLGESAAAARLLEGACYAIRWHYGAWTADAPRSPLYFAAAAQMGGVEAGSGGPEIAALCLQEADYYSSRRYLGVPDRQRMVAVLEPYREV
jgi:hypothetical protein